jgi:hypothetical protein
VTCNQPLFVSLFGPLTQTFANRFTIQGSGGDGVNCTPPSVPWKLTMYASTWIAQEAARGDWGGVRGGSCVGEWS